MKAASHFPSALAEIAAGRDFIRTSEYAHVTSRSKQTILNNYSRDGECFGIRPLKFGNKLLWSVAQIADLLNGNAK